MVEQALEVKDGVLSFLMSSLTGDTYHCKKTFLNLSMGPLKLFLHRFADFIDNAFEIKVLQVQIHCSCD